MERQHNTVIQRNSNVHIYRPEAKEVKGTIYWKIWDNSGYILILAMYAKKKRTTIY